jgi:iron-sulfur cluster protein
MKFLDQETKKSIKKTVFEYGRKRMKVLEEMKMNPEEYKEKMTKIRQKPFDNFEENLKIAKENLEQNGFNVHEAEDAEKAQEILKEILKDTEKIAKTKTNTGREIEIEKVLENYDSSETDLGDFINELFKEDDMHYVLPALHISPEKIREKIREVYGDEVEASPEKLTHYLCGKIREKILMAEVGITGANFFTQNGQVVLLENEGNISLVSRLPKKHVVVCGIDKLTKAIEDATRLCQTAAIFGTGQKITQYISIISGPSKTADIQNKLVQGAQGAKEVDIILIDNGRREMLKQGFGDLWRCINCGACINFCPVYHQLGRGYGGNKYIGSKGIVKGAFDGKFSLEKSEENGSFKCTFCGGCHKNCPMKINLPDLVRKIRKKQNENNFQTEQNKQMLKKIKKDGNPFGKVSDEKTPDKLYCC